MLAELQVVHTLVRLDRPGTMTASAKEFWDINQSVRYGAYTTILSTAVGIVDTGTTLILIATGERAADLHQMLKHLVDLHALGRVDQHAGDQVRSGQDPVC